MRSLCRTVAILLIIPALAVAQRPPERGERGGRGQLKIQTGDALPDLSGFDEKGEPIHLRDLKGRHAVIVFGCLT